MESNYSQLPYNFHWDREFSFKFLQTFQLIAPIISFLTWHPTVLFFLIRHPCSLTKQNRAGYIALQISLIFLEWTLCWIVRFYPLMPYPALYCDGILCNRGLSQQAIMAFTTVAAILPNSIFFFLLLSMHQTLLITGNSLFLLSQSGQSFVLITQIAICLSNVVGYGVFCTPSVKSQEIRERPEFSWLNEREGQFLIFGDVGSRILYLRFGKGNYKVFLYVDYPEWYYLLFSLGIISGAIMIMSIHAVYILHQSKVRAFDKTTMLQRRAVKILLVQLISVLLAYVFPLAAMVLLCILPFPDSVLSFARPFNTSVFISLPVPLAIIFVFKNSVYREIVRQNLRKIAIRIFPVVREFIRYSGQQRASPSIMHSLAFAPSSIDTSSEGMLVSLLFSSLVGIIDAAGRKAENCEVGDQWTANYIRFECYEGDGLVVKGVRAIGCVPSNSENGKMIATGSTFDEQYFTYNCIQTDEETVTYQIKNCRDADGAALLVDESRKAKDGTNYRCYRDNKGAVKLAVGGGCIHKGKLYTVGQKWIENEQMKDKAAGKEYVIGNGSRLWCTGDAKSGFRVEAYGCVVSTGVYLDDGGFTGVGKNFVQCKIAKTTAGKPGTTVSVKLVDESVVTCNDNGKIVKSHEQYTTLAGDVLLCKYCVLKKIACTFQGKQYKVGFFLHGGKPYECTKSGTGVFDFGPVTGCPMTDGSIKPFMARWYKDTEAYQCRYQLKAGKVTTYINVGCNNNGQAVVKYQVVGSGRNLRKCGLVPGKYYQMRDMTAAEIDAYYKSKSNSAATADVFGGVGGSGSGDELLGKPNSEPGKDGGKNVETCIAMCTESCKSSCKS